MSERNDNLLLEEILECIESIQNYSEGLDLERFLESRIVFDACLMNFVTIGESVNKLSEDFKASYENIDWFKIRGFRNRLAHDYRGTDKYMTWEIISNYLPALKENIEKILNK